MNNNYFIAIPSKNRPINHTNALLKKLMLSCETVYFVEPQDYEKYKKEREKS